MYEDIDPFASDWLVDYSKRPGILVDTSDFKPVDYFKLFFPSEAFNLIANETNRYAAQYLDSHPNLPQNSRFLAWRVTSPDEMQAFVALQIAMGLCEKPTVEDYWSKYWLTFTDFQKVMPRNRYELLQSFIHFCNLNDQVERGNEGYNPLFKIQPLLDLTDPTYEKVYQPKRSLSIDESMVKFKGRIFFRQYLPKKPTKWGIKEFMLSEAESGYALKSIIYTGKTSFTRDPGVNLTDQVVLTLLDGYEGKGHIVFMDNFYSSPGLYCMLEEKNIGACGTVAGNRVGMPSQLKRDDLKLKKGDEPVFMRCGNLVACAWQDTKRVTMLSTVDTNLTIDKKIRSKGSPGGCRLVSKPVMVERYNQCMAGVDRFDQMVGTYQYPHKCMKWYHTIYHRVIEVALVNGYIIYKKANTNNKLQ